MRLASFSLSALLGFVAIPALCQTYSVKAVTFSGYTGSSKEELLAASGLNPGRPVSAADLQAAAQKLNDSGVFSQVTYRFDGQQVVFQLAPMPTLVPAHFDNFAWADAAQIDSELRVKLPLYRGYVGYGSGLEQQMIQELTALAAAQHLQVTVVVNPVMDEKTKKLTAEEFRLASPTVKVAALTFVGASAELEKKLNAVAESAAGQEYSLHTTPEELMRSILTVYRNEGYLDAQVTQIKSGTAVITDEIRVPLKATLVEGGQYHVGKLTLDGSLLMTPEEFATKSALKSGDVASQELLRKSLIEVASPYRRKGYLDAKVSAAPDADAAKHVIDYAIHVEPGEPFHMGKMELTNLSDAQRQKFLSAWKMQPGDPYDEVYLILFVKRNIAGLHEFDGMSATYKQNVHQDTHAVDVVMSFQRGG